MFDFEGNLIVDSIELVPEQARPLYVEKDGKFVLSEALKPFALAYQGQTKALEKARKDLKAANDESASRRVTKSALVEFLKENGVDGIDESEPLNTLKAHVSALVEANKKNKELPVNLDKIKTESERRIAEVNSTAEAKIGKMQGTLNRYLVSQAATAALAKAGGNVDLLLDKVQKAARVVQDGEDFVVRIVDEAGEARSNGSGGWLDFDGYVSEMKRNPAYAVAFKSEAAAGTGHQPGSGARTVPLRTTEKTANEKIAAGLAKAQAERRPAA